MDLDLLLRSAPTVLPAKLWVGWTTEDTEASLRTTPKRFWKEDEPTSQSSFRPLSACGRFDHFWLANEPFHSHQRSDVTSQKFKSPAWGGRRVASNDSETPNADALNNFNAGDGSAAVCRWAARVEIVTEVA